MRYWSWYLLGSCSAFLFLVLLYRLTHPSKKYYPIPNARYYDQAISMLKDYGDIGSGISTEESTPASAESSKESQAGTPMHGTPVGPRDWLSSCPAGMRAGTGPITLIPPIQYFPSAAWCSYFGNQPSTEHGATGPATEECK